ncbi:MAG: hypothetical protein HY731_12270 [Candidatus Tectomicrobia bacterium]|nr:hypothetical protein [Candidatus Tectomicrobia bacterium]
MAFTEKDISRDMAARNELVKLGSQGTPTTVIDGEVVIGFDRRKLDALIAS